MKTKVLSILILVIIIVAACKDPAAGQAKEPVKYAITLPLRNNQGTEEITASLNSASEGERITLTCHLEAGRQVYLESRDVDLSSDTVNVDLDSVEFVMPPSDVEVMAIFADVPPPVVEHKITLVVSNAGDSESVSLSMAKAEAGKEINISSVYGERRSIEVSSGQVSLGKPSITANGSEFEFVMPAEDVTITAVFSDLEIGDVGPAGGIIFYDDTIGFDFNDSGLITSTEKNILSDGKRYLEVAPYLGNNSSIDLCSLWSKTDENINDISDFLSYHKSNYPEKDFGKGEYNSHCITTHYSGDELDGIAADYCEEYSGGNKDDWFLPSYPELLIIYSYKTSDNDFAERLNMLPRYYWTSSESASDTAWAIYFDDGSAAKWSKSNIYNTPYVRPIRSF